MGKALGASVICCAALFAGQAGWGQAMGKINLEGSAPAAAPISKEPAKGETSKAVTAPSLGSTTVSKSPAATPATRTAEVLPENKTSESPKLPATMPEARTVAPLPESKPVETAKPPAGASAVRTGGTFLDIPSPDSVMPAATLPVGRTTAPLPDIAPVETPKPPASAPAAPVGVATATQPVGSAPAKDVKPAADIEKAAIRRNASEEKAPAGGSTASGALSGLGGTGQVIAALAIVVGLIFIGRALVRKFVPGAGASNGKGVIEILARHPLSKNQAIVLVRIGSQIVAINQGRDTSQSVLVINEPMEVARIIGQIEGKNPASSQAGFNKLLANARMDLESGEHDAGTGSLDGENLDEQLEEMAAAKRQLMELRQHVRSVRDRLPREV